MKLQDLTFEILSAHGITRLPTTTDASIIVTSKLGFDMWKHEFERFSESPAEIVNGRVVVAEMESQKNKFIEAKAAALSSINY